MLWATKREREKLLSCLRLFATPWVVAYQAPTSMGFSRQEYWNRFPFPSSGDLPNPRIEPRSPALQTDALPSEPPGKPIALLTKSSLGWDTQFLRAWSALLSPLPGKAIKLFFSTSLKTLSLRFDLALVHRGHVFGIISSAEKRFFFLS